MSIMSVFSSLVSPVANAYKAHQERRANEEAAKAKLQLAKTDGEYKIQLTDAEWEALAVKGTESSWKDEYVTLVITSPLIGIFVGSLWFAVTGDETLLAGVNMGIANLTALGVDYGEVMAVVVYAAVGLKFWRGR